MATLAAARIGAITVPLSTFSTAPELRTLLRNSGVEMVLSAHGYRRHDYVERLAEAVPELDLRTSVPPLFSTTVPSLRRVAFDLSDDRVDPTMDDASPPRRRATDKGGGPPGQPGPRRHRRTAW